MSITTPHIHLQNWQTFEVEPTGEKNDVCDCCDSKTQHHWGFVHFEDSTIASYFVRWAIGLPDHGAWFNLVVGQWGNDADPTKRSHVALEFKLINRGPNFIVRNSSEANQDFSEIASSGSLRDDIIGTDLAPHIFAIIDAVYMSENMKDIRDWSQ